MLTLKFNMLEIKEKVNESSFPNYIRNLNFETLKINGANLPLIESNLQKIDSKKHLCAKDILSTGVPDFFIYNSKEYYFCELKSKSDTLRNSQWRWFANHPELKIMLAKEF